MTTKIATKTETKKVSNTEAVRINPLTKAKIEEILIEANKKDWGRKVRPDELIQTALGLVTDKHIKMLRKKSLTNGDRKLYLFQKFKELNPKASKDDWEGFQMTPDWLRFVKEHGDFERAV